MALQGAHRVTRQKKDILRGTMSVSKPAHSLDAMRLKDRTEKLTNERDLCIKGWRDEWSGRKLREAKHSEQDKEGEKGNSSHRP